MAVGELFDLDRLDDTDPFEIDRQAAHLFKHDPYGIDDIYEIWNSDPMVGCELAYRVAGRSDQVDTKASTVQRSSG